MKLFIGYLFNRLLSAKALRSVRCLSFIFTISCSLIPNYTRAQTSDLENIQALIQQTKQALEKNLRASERLQQELKLAELEIAKTATLLNQTDRSLKVTRDEKRALEAEQKSLLDRIKEQQDLLASQLKSAYMAGNYDFAKMFFNQDDAGRFERVLTYYKYLNKARQEQIEAFKTLIDSLEKVELELTQKESQLDSLLVSQKAQSDQLRSQQQARHAKLRELDKAIETDTAKVQALQQEEQALIAAIEQAEREARAREARRTERERLEQSVALRGLQKYKGKLSRPSEGRMRNLFGKRRQGQVRWKGVVFASPEGTPVNAVQDGRVLYADWLKGFGLVTIVDHGEGYMTVYGRNQALLTQAGQVVSKGETIGLVGNSGGQATTGLYFELRHKGKALNPASWLSRLN